MTMENIPWGVNGGIVSASLARMLAYQATGSEEGVAGLGDFLVTQTTVASGTVNVANGGGIMLNRYPGAKNESYMCRAGDSTPVAVPPNATGSPRTDMLVAYIDDWNFAGQQATPATLPTNSVPAAKFKVITNVPASAKKFSDLAGANYPGLALARITVPANTSAITKAMIYDLREKAVPRRKRDLRAVGQLAGRDNTLAVTTAAGEQFPNDGVFTVEIPYWASRVRVKHDLAGILSPAGSSAGVIWVRIGHGRADAINTQASAVDTPNHADPMRVTGMSADDVAIPAAMRGQSVTVLLMGKKTGGTVGLKADFATAMTLDLEFVEAATEDV